MAFTLEVTISGLVILAVRSADPKPTESDLVEVICPAAHMHQPRLSFNLLDLRRTVGSDLDIAPNGDRIAALDLRSRFLDFVISGSEGGKRAMEWRQEEAETPADKEEERFMDWLPTIETLGFDRFTIPPGKLLPAGASTRIKLPPGKIACTDVIPIEERGKYLRYLFGSVPASPPFIRAVATDIVFRSYGVETLIVYDHHEGRVLSSSGPIKGDTLSMCISNDLSMVSPPSRKNVQLHHLEHLSSVAPVHGGGKFEPPEPIDENGGRTGDAICTGALFIHNQGG